jgi:hypothetical protein
MHTRFRCISGARWGSRNLFPLWPDQHEIIGQIMFFSLSCVYSTVSLHIIACLGTVMKLSYASVLGNKLQFPAVFFIYLLWCIRGLSLRIWSHLTFISFRVIAQALLGYVMLPTYSIVSQVKKEKPRISVFKQCFQVPRKLSFFKSVFAYNSVFADGLWNEA